MGRCSSTEAGTGVSKRDQRRLAGRVVVVRATEAGVARALSADGAAVVLLAIADEAIPDEAIPDEAIPDEAIPDEDGDAARAGALARELADAGGRAVVFVGDPTDEACRAALAEMISELFP